MDNKYEYAKKEEYKFWFRQENIEMIGYSIISFFLPFLIGHPQQIVGVLVNAMLVMSALNLKGYRLLPVIIAPTLGVFARGIIFGPFTIFLAYMIPFIWIGNFILVYAFQKLKVQKKINSWITLAIGALAKTAFLFTIAYLLVNVGIIPALFLTTMGVFQLYTAIAGGIIAIGIQTARKNLSTQN
jgi:hypothetical protein